MPKAANLIRPVPPYRHDAFASGLARLGYDVAPRIRHPISPDDVLVIWNRKAQEELAARRFEEAGARVIIAENGYIGKSPSGAKLYALALGHHNGVGRWPVGGPERLEHQMATGWKPPAIPFGATLLPWRGQGGHILILPQRGIGAGGVAMPYTWPRKVQERLRRITDRPIRIRQHPGDTKVEPWGAFDGAWAAVTWGSGAAIKAIVAGLPVFHELPGWIGAGASTFGLGPIEQPWMGDRLPMLQRLAWAQWSAEEIQSGEALEWLLKGPLTDG